MAPATNRQSHPVAIARSDRSTSFEVREEVVAEGTDLAQHRRAVEHRTAAGSESHPGLLKGLARHVAADRHRFSGGQNVGSGILGHLRPAPEHHVAREQAALGMALGGIDELLQPVGFSLGIIVEQRDVVTRRIPRAVSAAGCCGRP